MLLLTHNEWAAEFAAHKHDGHFTMWKMTHQIVALKNGGPAKLISSPATWSTIFQILHFSRPTINCGRYFKYLNALAPLSN